MLYKWVAKKVSSWRPTAQTSASLWNVLSWEVSVAIFSFFFYNLIMQNQAEDDKATKFLAHLYKAVRHVFPKRFATNVVVSTEGTSSKFNEKS